MAHHAFGIELEFSNVTPRQIEAAFAAHGIEGMIAKLDGTPTVTAEINFPPLAVCPFAWRYIRNVMDALASIGTDVNAACGMHIHVSNAPLAEGVTPASFSRRCIEAVHNRQPIPALFGEPLDAVAVRDIVLRYTAAQSQINAMHPPSRTNNRHALPLTDRIARLTAASTIVELTAATHNKFSTVNLIPWSRGTIEFRQAASTVEFEKVEAWVLFVLNLIRWTTTERLDRSATVTTEHTTPERPYRAGSRLDVIWRACRSAPIGATVRELMNLTGTSAVNIRARISEMRAQHGDDAIITHNQQENGHAYGDGDDLARYEIRERWTTTQIGAVAIRDGVMTSIWAGLDDDTFEFWQNRIDALSARRRA
jgi:hypothetical protein